MSAAEIDFTAIGDPAPAGSKRAFVVNGRARMVESSKKVRPWWQSVTGAAQEALPDDWEMLLGPVMVEIVFYIKRPAYHFRTGKRAHELRPDAPTFVDKKPDSDKLARTVLDALRGAGVYRDDAQVARLVADKRYANRAAGARIVVAAMVNETSGSASLGGEAAPATSIQEALI